MLTLVAEDNEGLKFLLTEFFKNMGHTVKSAENGLEMIKIALEERPDLIVTDLHMPQMSANSIITMLDMYHDLSEIPVIVITGANPNEIEDMNIPKEIPVLSKPFNFTKLMAEVEKIAVK